MCNGTLKDRKSSDDFRDLLGLVSIRNCIQRGRLRWFGHVERMGTDSLVKMCRETAVEGHRRRRMDTDSLVKKCRETAVEGHRGRDRS